jgi:hypothetical protein
MVCVSGLYLRLIGITGGGGEDGTGADGAAVCVVGVRGTQKGSRHRGKVGGARRRLKVEYGR